MSYISHLKWQVIHHMATSYFNIVFADGPVISASVPFGFPTRLFGAQAHGSVWSQTRHLFAFLRFCPFTKRKLRPILADSSPLPSSHQLWSLVLICDAILEIGKKKKIKTKQTNKP